MKKLLASLMALSMVFAVTGCSESSDSSSESKAEAKTTTTTTAAPAVESKADTTTTTAAPEESAADTTTSANDTTSTGDEAKGTYKDNVYTSDLYTFKIDSKKWAMQESASINVISMSNDLLNGLTASDYADQIKQTYNSMDGYTVTNDKEDKFAGKDAYIVDVTGEIGSQKVLLNQIITSDNGNLVVITYGASENAYSKLSDEFKSVLDSFELK